MRARTRRPLAERFAPAGISVLALPFYACEERPDGVHALLRDLLCSLPPGWTWDVADFDETRRDAIACARHQARLRGDVLEVVEELPLQPALVLVRTGNERPRRFWLVVVRFSRLESTQLAAGQ